MELENNLPQPGRNIPVSDFHSFLLLATLAISGIVFWLLLTPWVLERAFDIPYTISQNAISTGLLWVIGGVTFFIFLVAYRPYYHQPLH
ncbi:MAG TPA: hypothetical protein VGE18_01100 [Candidatus Paceibacterota bacterium]